MKLEELRTPCALVDLQVMDRNTALMGERMRALGVKLRPHVKTHKCAEAARFQVRGHFGGVTVSTLAEARFLAKRGFRDLTYAFPLPLDALTEVVEISRSVDRLNLLLDQEATLRELESCAAQTRLRFPVFLKVDCGYHRAGVDPEREESVALAARLARSAHLDFRGILTHAGHSYGCRNPQEIREVARQECQVMVGFAEKLRSAGIPVNEVSVGSTPTMSLAEELRGITEARPGNYVFYDGFQAAIGSCRLEDVAFSILVSVVGHYPEQNRLLVNAGALALSKDPGARHLAPDFGYGSFASLDGSRRYPELKLYSLSQEHGQVRGTRPLDFAEYPVGAKLRVIPNHSCLTAALYDRYYVLRGGAVVDEWQPVRGW
jgi:D-serine deaminase-like pyridoxal phosphate-dependent protein